MKNWVFITCMVIASGAYGYFFGKNMETKAHYQPYGKLTLRQAETEVLIHRVDKHKVYTCEEDPIPDSEAPGHYAVIDQNEALAAGYTPLGQGYCDRK